MNLRPLIAGSYLVLGATAVSAAEPDGLTLPPGFHATVVADALGPVRHLAIRSNGDIYLSTPRNKQGIGGGIIALHMDANHKADRIEHFGAVDGGTGIRFYRGALYAASPSRIYRYSFTGDALLPQPEPEVIVDGMPVTTRTGNRGLAFDKKNDLFVTLDASANLCINPAMDGDAVPVGRKPCPDLATHAGIWSFKAAKVGQQFSQGTHVATGLRDTTALDWSPTGSSLYVFVHGRDDSHKFWPNLFTTADDDHVADELHRVIQGADLGWPYTYYDGARNVRLVSPEYGGDGKTRASGDYSMPVATFFSRRAAPVDLLFYEGKNFPSEYRGGAFVALHASGGEKVNGGMTGDDIAFIPFDRDGKAGSPAIFADGFAGPDQASKRNGRTARYRPVGIAVGPDGALYVADSQKGRIWRIAYGGN